MKIYFTLIGLILLTTSANAQNIQDQKLTYSYIQLPSAPFSSGTETFNVRIDQQFIKANEDSLASYESKLETARLLRAEQMKIWEEEKVKLDKVYYAQMANYEKQLAAGTPNLVMPVMPSENSCPCVPDPKKPMLTNEFETIEYSNRISIDGFERNEGGANIVVEFAGFTKGLITEKVKEKSGVKTYTYEYQYTYPIKLIVKDQGGSITLTKDISPVTYTTISTSNFNSKYDYLAWKVDSEEAFWTSIETSEYNSSVSSINNIISEQFGYPTKNRSTEIYTAKDKNHDYTDLLQGYQHAQNGYLALANDRDKQAAMTNLIKAIESWESTLKESNISDKKARVSKKVTAALYVNIAEAYLWMDDFSAAELNANKAKNLSIGKYTRHAKQLISFIQAQKVRFDAQ